MVLIGWWSCGSSLPGAYLIFPFAAGLAFRRREKGVQKFGTGHGQLSEAEGRKRLLPSLM